MTADAQALQVALVMSAAICQRFDVMHQSGLGKSSLTLTPFTKRMAADVAVPNLTPVLIVPLVVVVATGEMLVVPFHHLAVVFAVTAFVVCQLWAATIPTGSLWFSWHSDSPRFRAHSPSQLLSSELFLSYLCQSCQFTPSSFYHHLSLRIWIKSTL